MSSQKFTMSKNQEGVIMVPLGGCGVMGKNMTLYCYKGTWIMVDIGMSFSDERITPGVDMIIPDIDFIRKNKIKISAIILTHVHEDHVGAIPYYIEELDCPVYGTNFAIEFARLKLQDRRVDPDKVEFKKIDQDEIKIGTFSLSPVGITHSIPEMKGFFITAGDVKIFHTGDWKIDENPVVGDVTDIKKIEKFAKSGITAMVCDSTNILSKGHSRSEGDLYESLLEIVKTAKNRVLITSFASNIARIQTIAKVAKDTGRYFAISGLSLNKMTAIAAKIGYLSGLHIIDSKEAMKLPRNEVLFMVTGCQGEPLASTAKISNNSHPVISVKHGDLVIFSSKIIPGNEKKIGATLNRFAEKDIEVITEKDHFVHVSGHPYQDELKQMYELVKPKFAIPVHGDSVNLRAHCAFVGHNKLAESAFFVNDGNVLLITANETKVVGKVNVDFICVDGNYLIKPSDNSMSERRNIKDNGVIVCSILLKKGVISDAKISTVGVLTKELSDKLISNVKKIIKKDCKVISAKKAKNENANERVISQFIREIVSKEIRKLGKRPLIEVFVHSV